jgi:hypothetical protein
MRKIRFLLATSLALGLMAGTALADVNAVTPSTNEINKTNGWAYVDFLPDDDIGSVDVEFVSTRGFASCFEYRSDGDTGQKIADDNYNTDVDDGLYPFTCISDESVPMTLYAIDFVEVRMVFGAEGDERFDWTPFDVPPDATKREDCFKAGWETFGFSNQGQCVRFVNTGKDSR